MAGKMEGGARRLSGPGLRGRPFVGSGLRRLLRSGGGSLSLPEAPVRSAAGEESFVSPAARRPLFVTSPAPPSVPGEVLRVPPGSLGRRRPSPRGRRETQADSIGSSGICGCGWKRVGEFTVRSAMGRRISH